MPGISRSGATIATALMTGLERELAFRFSFLLSIPAVFGATVLKAKDIKTQMLYGNSVFFLIGALTAMIFGILAIKILLGVVKNNRLYLFGIYCLVSGIVVLICFR
jgi:undecaprenyl-diphosphatase